MTSPYNFDSSDDYYDSFLNPWQLKLRDDMENGDIDPEIYERRLSVYNALHNNLGVYNWIKENYSSIVDIIENNWTP